MRNTICGLMLSMFFALLFSLTITAQSDVFDQSFLSEKGKQAYSTLVRVQMFSVGGIGYSGQTSKGELALDVLIEENQATLSFKQLIADGTLEGGLYGVVGLKMLGCDCFDQEFLRYKELHFGKDNTEKFTIQFGCMGMSSENPSEKDMILNEISTFIFEAAERKECGRMTNGNAQSMRECFAIKKANKK